MEATNPMRPHVLRGVAGVYTVGASDKAVEGSDWTEQCAIVYCWSQ